MVLTKEEYLKTLQETHDSNKISLIDLVETIIEKHGIFQMYYYAHHLGGDKNERDKFKGHKYYNDTINFCENWDQKSFDPNYKSLALKDFEPYVKKIFGRTPYSN